MLPSKENCTKALHFLEAWEAPGSDPKEFVREFLRAALKRLPKEATLERDRYRGRALAQPAVKPE